MKTQGSSNVSPQSEGTCESLGQNVPTSLVLQVMKETNRVQLLVVLLFGVVAVSCTSEPRQSLHAFFPFDI